MSDKIFVGKKLFIGQNTKDIVLYDKVFDLIFSKMLKDLDFLRACLKDHSVRSDPV